MTTSLALYAAYTGLALLLCAWAAYSGATRGGATPWSRIRVTAAAIAVPVVGLYGAVTQHPEPMLLAAVTAAWPALVLLCAWSNLAAVHNRGVVSHALHLPAFAWNVALAGVYTVVALQQLAGLDCGLIGTAVCGGLTMTRVDVGGTTGAATWHYLPLLLPLGIATASRNTALLVSATAGSALLATLVGHMPFAYARADSYRAARLSAAADTRIGVAAPWTDAVVSSAQLRRWREDLSDLAPAFVTIALRPEVLGDAGLRQQMQREVETAQASGIEVIAIVLPPAKLTATDLDSMVLQMTKTHWLVAQEIRPDVLVIFPGPFTRWTRASAGRTDIDQWMAALTRSRRHLVQAAPELRVAAMIESRAPHAEELYRRLRGPGSPLDAVALSARDRSNRDFGELLGDLTELARWSVARPGSRPLYWLEAGTEALDAGGELGQWHYLQAVLSQAAGCALAGVSISPLTAAVNSGGLTTGVGRRRLAYRQLAQRNRAAAPR